MSDIRTHYKEVQKVLWIVLVLNWAVAAAKIVFGLASRSSSMAADGFHSLADGTSNIIGLVGIRFCFQPKDEDHPYGHRKYETLFALAIAAMLFVVAFGLARGGIERLFKPVTPQVDFISFAVMLTTLVVNIIVMLYEYRRGKQLGSDILVVDSMHTRADIFTSISVIAALIGVKLGYPIVDPIVTLLISGFVAYSAFEIVREESGILCDAAVIRDTDKVRDVVLGVDKVVSCHKIRSRGRFDDVNLDLHVQVDGLLTLAEAHGISHRIQAEISRMFPHVSDVMVHMEPSSNETS
ncbi:MAG: cation diffusion facilitator family transporter [Candidatus Omnitrophota bacterium]